jgi:alpha-glucoside transport system permease protein
MSTTTAAAAKPQPATAMRSRRWVAWLFLLPTFVLFLVFMVYPTIYTILLSFDRGRRGEFTQFLGLDNYVTLLTKDPAFLNLKTFPPSGAVFNNLLWAILYVSFVIAIGLFIAVAATRVRYESIIKAVVFVPMAIGATAMALIWNFMYAPSATTGLLNALLDAIGRPPVSWLGDPGIVNMSLIAVGVWGSVGFATVIMSAAIKAIPSEIMEAARTDGANERQLFFKIIVPMVSLPIAVLAVTLIVNVVKLFDLVYVMTRGGPGTSSRVIAFSMYQEAFPGGLYGKGAAVAVIMLVLLVPIMGFNIRRFRADSVR